MAPIRTIGLVLLCGSVACHHRAHDLAPTPAQRVETIDMCSDAPSVGPASRIELSRAMVADSVVSNSSLAQLLVLLRWSSDSLARQSGPVLAIGDLTAL